MPGIPPFQSIAARLFISATVWIASILIVAGLGLTALNRRASEAAFDDRLGVYLKALVANGVAGGDDARAAAAPQVDPQFELAFSGWYWQVTRLDVAPREIRSSPSLFATQLPGLEPGLAPNPDGVVSGYVIGPGDKPLRTVERTIDAGDEGRFLVQVAANSDVIQKQIAAFETGLWATFLALAAALLGSTAFAVRFGLRPLRALTEGVAQIRRGEAERVVGEFPDDVAPLADEVNLLLDANREIVERARTQVGNLAHALKTPLSVIVNEADSPSGGLPEKVREQADIMRRQMAFYLDRARAAARAGALGAVTDVDPVVAGLVRTFEKVHRGRGLTFDVGGDSGTRFRGESQDLTDLIGNLLDNSGKWAAARIAVTVRGHEGAGTKGRTGLQLVIDDDGPGLPAQARAQALERGRRLDESRPGSGLGLSIVADLAALYGGALSLGDSPLGGLRATLELPRA